MAFYVLENVRRTKFEQPVFDAAFRAAFLDTEPFDNSAEAEARLLTEVRQSSNADNLSQLADIYISRSEWEAARAYLSQAIELDPSNFSYTVALAEIYRREGENDQANHLIEEFLGSYPDSVEAARYRVDQALAAADGEEQNQGARVLLDQKLGQFPDDGKLLFNLGVLLQREGDDEGAGKAFARAAEAAPQSAHIQGWTGRFFLKVLRDSRQALDYYLSAYFLDPHFYDSEYAESRIRELAWNLAAEVVETIRGRPNAFAKMLQSHNPRVVGFGLEKLEEDWNEQATEDLFGLLGHDDVYVRWKSMETLRDRAPAVVLARLDNLLLEEDLRVRGLAAYLAMRLGSAGHKEVVKSMLRSDAQLVRYDAISALLMEGGAEGHALIRALREREGNPWLRRLLDSIPEEYAERDQQTGG